jgi:AcrR family transcriptional regulator
VIRAIPLLAHQRGVEAVTDRAVCQAAGVTKPTLYHHFGDKDDLLRSVVARGVNTFTAQKPANRQTADAMADLRSGWLRWIAFALERPKLFRLMIESTRSDPSASQEGLNYYAGDCRTKSV